MFSHLVIWVIAAYNVVAPDTQSIKVFGRGYDDSTAVSIHINIFADIDNQRVKLGESNKDGNFEVRIPISAKSLTIESAGFHRLSFPVNFIGPIEGEPIYNLTIPMSKQAALPIKIFCNLSLTFNDPNTWNVNCDLVHAKDLSPVSSIIESKYVRRTGSPNIGFNIKPDKYLLMVYSPTGLLLSKEDMIVKPGYNFKSVHLKDAAKSSLVAVPNTTTLYFDQSSHTLSDDAKMVLDSAAKYLATNPKSIIRITGYTDNVGNREPNVILSEYRARAVAGYLQQKNVNTSQIITKWEGPDNQLKDANTATNKNRRAVIQIIR